MYLFVIRVIVSALLQLHKLCQRLFPLVQSSVSFHGVDLLSFLTYRSSCILFTVSSAVIRIMSWCRSVSLSHV